MASTTVTQTTVYLPNILLDESNYPTWLFRLESFLKGQNLYGFVDGTTPCPAQDVTSFDGSTRSISSEYVAWKTQDQSIVNMIGQTLSPIAMSCAVGSRSAQEMWTNLKNKFAAPNRQNILQFKSNLQNLKKGNDSIETYLDKIKAARDVLETVGMFLDDEDIVVTVLRGLPSEYAAIETVIRAQFVSCSVGELKTLLKPAEIDIENESSAISSTPLSAMMATANSSTSKQSQASSFASISYSVTPAASSSAPSHDIPPGFTAASSSAPSLAIPPGFTPISSQTPYIPIPAMPYGFNSFNPFNTFDPNINMGGFYAGRGSPRFNTGRNNFGPRGNAGNIGLINGFNPNAGNNAGPPINLGFNNYRNNAGGISCQLCGRNGHGARTCRSLSNILPTLINQQQNVNGGCQVCGIFNHTAERCYHIIGFPNQQQAAFPNQQQQQAPPAQFQTNGGNGMLAGNAMNAMMAAATQAPQYWLADTGATNHMTNEVQLLNNIAPYPHADTVQVGNGQGAGQDTVQRTE